MTYVYEVAEIGPKLALEAVGPETFQNRFNETNLSGTLFGGQVLGQSLGAAIKTVEGREIHAFHAYFLRSGSAAMPVTYKVETVREGLNFAVRRVVGLQNDAIIFEMLASFHRPEDTTFAHEVPPALGGSNPDRLKSLSEIAAEMGDRLSPEDRQRMHAFSSLEIKPTDPARLFAESRAPMTGLWVRIPTAAGLDAAGHRCALAYLSDSWLASAARMMHGPLISLSGVRIASLNHAMWFHAPADPAEWHLYEIESPWTGHGRGLARGRLFNRQGALVASTAQELVLRKR